jgi:uncharacterized protein YbjT (DUF2867 family)
MILVVGATGTTGSGVVRELVARGAPVRALTRDPGAADALRALGAEPAVGDLADPASLAGPLRGVERVFLATPASADQPALEANLVAVAEQSGAYHVVKLGALGQAPGATFRFGANHAEAFAALQATSLRWTLLQPGGFMQNALRAAPAIARGRYPSALDAARVAWVDARDVAAAAARTLTEEGHDACSYVLTGPQALTDAEVCGLLSAALGHPVVHEPCTDEEVAAVLRGIGAPEWNVAGVGELAAFYRSGGAAAVSPDLGALLGREPTGFRQFAEDHRALLGGTA